MNKYQNFYINTTLEELDQQYKIVNKKLEEIYKEFATNREVLIDKLSKVMMEYNISVEYMELTAKEKAKVKKELQMTIYDIVAEEKEKEKEFIKNTLGDSIKNTYEYQEYLLQLGIDFKTLPLTKEVIKEIVNKKIIDKRWDYRLWENKDILGQYLKKDINDFLNGKISVNKIGQTIRKHYETDMYKSQRLVRTELCRVQQDILNKFDKAHDIEYQLFMATLDNRTSETCQQYDNKEFKINDTNKPIPPLHPHCRSALVGIPSKEYRPTTRRDNENKDIIEYMSYDEWKKNN